MKLNICEISDKKSTENCVVCGTELEYLNRPVENTCMFCNKTENGYFVCPNGHYVCDSCHNTEALDIIERFCLQSDSENPMEMALTIMRHPRIPMHGSDHHGMIAAVLVAAYKNITGEGTEDDIREAIRRGSQVPAGYCGLFGTDAAAIATGIAVAVILKATPLSDVERSRGITMTSRALAAISNNRGPRCCKCSTMAVLEVTTEYFREVMGVEFGHVPAARLRCEHNHRNKVCAKEDCRYYPG